MNISLKISYSMIFKVYFIYVDAWKKKIHMVDQFSISIFFCKGLRLENYFFQNWIFFKK